MSNVPLKDLKYSRLYVRSVYCRWKKFSDLNQNGCEIVRATDTPESHCSSTSRQHVNSMGRFRLGSSGLGRLIYDAHKMR